MTAAPAAAHGQLVAAESTPVEGARIGEAMTELSLVFTEAPAPFAFFSVTAPDGTRVDDGWDHGEPFPLATPVQEFSLVDEEWEPVYYSTGFPVELGVAHWPAAGEYTVEYASVASDGDVVDGSYVFTYAGEPTQAPAGWAPPTQGPDPQLAAAEGAEPGAAAAAAPSTVAGQAAPAAEATTQGTPVVEAAADGPAVQPAVYVVIGVLVLAAIAAIVVVGRRGRTGNGVAGAGLAPIAAGRSTGRGPTGAGGSQKRASARSGNPAVRAAGQSRPGSRRGRVSRP
ncbi:copper resistance protein CopC [Aquipuribacter sp. MA13-13]|uniref:copper resistance CopC family protein n=1 Tax=Aquipuribacter sp. MA13-13 TaxID=3440840 RepID=UPI003F4950D9